MRLELTPSRLHIEFDNCTVTKRIGYKNDVQPAEVNWASIGSTTFYKARKFADEIERAVQKAGELDQYVTGGDDLANVTITRRNAGTVVLTSERINRVRYLHIVVPQDAIVYAPNCEVVDYQAVVNG